MTLNKMGAAARNALHSLTKKRSIYKAHQGLGFYVVRVTEKEADAGKAPSGFYVMHKCEEGRHRLYGPVGSLTQKD